MSRSLWKSTFRCICAWHIHLSISFLVFFKCWNFLQLCQKVLLKYFMRTLYLKFYYIVAQYFCTLFCYIYIYIEYEIISNHSYIAIAVKFFQLVPKLYLHEFLNGQYPKIPAVEKSALQYLFFDLNFNIELLRFQQLFCREKYRSVYTKWRSSQWCFVIEWNVCYVIADDFLVTSRHFVLIILSDKENTKAFEKWRSILW